MITAAPRTFRVRTSYLNSGILPVYGNMSRNDMVARVFSDQQFGQRIMSVFPSERTLEINSLAASVRREAGWDGHIKWRSGSGRDESDLKELLIGRLGALECLEPRHEARYGGIYIPGRAQLIDLIERIRKESGYYYLYYTTKVLGPSFKPGLKDSNFLSIEQLLELNGGKPIKEQTFWYENNTGFSLSGLFMDCGRKQQSWATRGLLDIDGYKADVLCGKCTKYIHILSCDEDAAVLESRLFGSGLAGLWSGRNKESTIYLLASGSACRAIKENNKDFRTEDEEGHPKAVFGMCNVVLIDTGENRFGINLENIPEEAKQLLLSADGASSIVGVSGEANNLTVHNFTICGKKVPHYRIFISASDITQKMTGLFWMEEEGVEERPYPVIIKVPADVPGPPAMDFVGVRKVRMSMSQYHAALAAYYQLKSSQKDETVQRMMNHGFSIYEAMLDSSVHAGYCGILSTHGISSFDLPFSDFVSRSCMESNTEQASGIIRNKGGRLSTRVYETERYTPVADRRDILMNAKGVNATVLSAIFPLQTIGTDNKVGIFECYDIPGHMTSLSFPDRLIRLARAAGQKVFFVHTAGYFWPKGLYDSLEKAAPEDFQRVQQLHSLIDGRAHFADGHLIISPPTYNKGFIAMTDKGIDFGRWKLPEIGTAQITVPGRGLLNISWKNGNVNPFSDRICDMDIAVLTPRHGVVKETDDIEDPSQDRAWAYSKIPQYKMEFTSDRINIAVWNNKAYFFEGPAYLQPEGIIISAKKDAFDLTGIEMSDALASSYFPYEINFDDNILPELKGQAEWVYGGLTLFANAPADKFHIPLIDHIAGKAHLFGRAMQEELTYLRAMARANFHGEGWFNEMSRLTQTTQLQRILVRGPRCFLVKTRDYYMPVVVEGKADDYSRGADFGEAIFFGLSELYHHIADAAMGDRESARKDFERQIRYLQMMNLDGGASVGMGVVDDNGAYIPISNRGPGPNNGYGSERPIPSLFMYF